MLLHFAWKSSNRTIKSPVRCAFRLWQWFHTDCSAVSTTFCTIEVINTKSQRQKERDILNQQEEFGRRCLLWPSTHLVFHQIGDGGREYYSTWKSVQARRPPVALGPGEVLVASVLRPSEFGNINGWFCNKGAPRRLLNSQYRPSKHLYIHHKATENTK